MKAVFIGHQSWLINYGSTNILIDPVLDESFGSADDNSIEIFPPRTIDIKKIPKIDAIILSHEHSDHFHIPTLLHFKDVPIIVSPIMVGCVTDIITSFGLNYKIIPFCEVQNIGELEVILYPAAIETMFWESRVSQILLRARADTSNSLFIAVDALISEQFKSDVVSSRLQLPTAIMVSNNSQFTPKGVLGSLDNYKNETYNNKKEIPGLSLLKELLITYLKGVEEINNIIICGGGFTKKYDTYFGCFPISEQNKLADIANYFSIDKNILGPLPGQTINIQNERMEYTQPVDWIRLNEIRLKEIYNEGIKFRNNPIKINIKPILNTEILYEESDLYTELNKLAKVFMLSEIGGLAIDFISSQTFDVLPYGLAFKLRAFNNPVQLEYYVLNLNSACFELIQENNVKEELIPFGVELFLNDLIGILKGEIQIWDLGGIAVKSWYLGEDKTNSPVGFLYSYFGEQAYPTLNYKSFLKRWKV